MDLHLSGSFNICSWALGLSTLWILCLHRPLIWKVDNPRFMIHILQIKINPSICTCSCVCLRIRTSNSTFAHNNTGPNKGQHLYLHLSLCYQQEIMQTLQPSQRILWTNLKLELPAERSEVDPSWVEWAAALVSLIWAFTQMRVQQSSRRMQARNYLSQQARPTLVPPETFSRPLNMFPHWWMVF